MLRKLLLLMPLAAGAGLVLASPAMATTVCVSSTAQLRSALASWQSASGGTYTIKLVQGTYPYPNLDYWSQPYAGGDARLLLLGGYTAGCSSRSLVATNTVLDGQQATHDSEFGVYGASSILVEGITFKSFARSVTIDGDSNDAADSIVVRYVIGTDLFGAASTQLSFAGFSVSGKSNIRVESSLFYNVHGGDTAAGLGVFGYDDNVAAVITNVTSAYNGARGLQMGCYQCSGSVLAYNTILYNNAAGDLDTRNSASIPVIAYSDLDPSRVAGLTTSLGNINADPRFQNPLNGNFLLLSNSPAINIGAAESTVPGGYASQDLDGGTRVIGSRVDLGAFESNINDLVAQTVTSSGDDSLNATLRTAINTANTNPNATTINFNIAYDGFPANTIFTGLHIHEGVAGMTGSVVFDTGISPSFPLVSPTGKGTINIPVTITFSSGDAAKRAALASGGSPLANDDLTRAEACNPQPRSTDGKIKHASTMMIQDIDSQRIQ